MLTFSPLDSLRRDSRDSLTVGVQDHTTESQSGSLAPGPVTNFLKRQSLKASDQDSEHIDSTVDYGQSTQELEQLEVDVAQFKAMNITTIASSRGVAENWSCSRAHIIHDVYISYKQSQYFSSIELATRLEAMTTSDRKTGITCHHFALCRNRGDVFEKTLTEALPRSKIFIILVCPSMLESFQTAHQRTSFPLQELEMAIELEGRPKIVPIFFGTSPTQILQNLDQFPNEPHFQNPMSQQNLPVREIVKILCQKWGHFVNITDPDIEGLAAKISTDVTNLEQKDLRWKWLNNTYTQPFDAFISYRVATEKKLARNLFYVLSTQRQKVQHLERGLTIYLDQIRLVNGENWETGFINGLRNSSMVLFLVSRNAVEGFKTAHVRPDNFFLEMEVAFDILDHRLDRGIVIQPVFVDGYIPNPQDFPDECHSHQSSPRMSTISNLIKRLVHLQGLRAYVTQEEGELGACESIAPQVLDRLKDKWEVQRKQAERILLGGFIEE
ncbi:hypothetical protein HDU99_008300 [Rhizoclosmatium hyalinum]|nr:hypothetical protein HDU99_008300 [Rhizoclosmatium hyalinum]